MGETKEFHLASDEHGGMETGAKVTLRKDHREFGHVLSSGTVLVIDSIIHFPTRCRLKDDSGKIWTVPIHSVRTGLDAKDAELESAEEADKE